MTAIKDATPSNRTLRRRAAAEAAKANVAPPPGVDHPVEPTHMALPMGIFNELNTWLGSKPSAETARQFFLMGMAIPVHLAAANIQDADQLVDISKAE